jgi:hypothetical protein
MAPTTEPGDAHDKAAKLEFIRAFFDYAVDRSAFLRQLFDQGRQDEAVTLCCCYIDGLANMVYWDSDRSQFNFVRLLREHGKHPDLEKATALALIRWIETSRAALAPIAVKIRQHMSAELTRIQPEVELRARLQRLLSPPDFQQLSHELWRATLASIAYQRMRVPFVHRLGGPAAVVVGSGDHRSADVIHIDFGVLHAALDAIIAHFRELSISTGRWFGHDRV